MRYSLLPWFALLALVLTVSGCRDDKDTGAGPIYQPNSTSLFFADCEPFFREPGLTEGVTLVPDVRDACNGMIQFFGGGDATWRSNAFFAPAGTYTEGYYLVFERDLEHAGEAVQVLVRFSGLAVDLRDTLTIPAGQTRVVFERHEVATLSDTGVVARNVEITIAQVPSWVRLNAGTSTGSYVRTEVEPAHLCRLELVPDDPDGIGQPNGGLGFSHAYAAGQVHDSLVLDFTGGAVLQSNGLVFGPDYGVAYVMAESGGCRDTAAFWALAPSQSHRVDTLGVFESRWSVISDGNRVWLYALESLGPDSVSPYVLQVNHETEAPLIRHRVFGFPWRVSAYFDRQNDLIWIVWRSFAPGEMDSAWGYSEQGILDSLIVVPDFPEGHIFQGGWLYETDEDRLRREIALNPLNLFSQQTLGVYPAELTEDFAGQAGIGRPGAARSEDWTINTFDLNGRWTGRYPVLLRDQGTGILGVDMILADEVIVYGVHYSDRIEVRALVPR